MPQRKKHKRHLQHFSRLLGTLQQVHTSETESRSFLILLALAEIEQWPVVKVDERLIFLWDDNEAIAIVEFYGHAEWCW